MCIHICQITCTGKFHIHIDGQVVIGAACVHPDHGSQGCRNAFWPGPLEKSLLIPPRIALISSCVLGSFRELLGCVCACECLFHATHIYIYTCNLACMGGSKAPPILFLPLQAEALHTVWLNTERTLAVVPAFSVKLA